MGKEPSREAMEAAAKAVVITQPRFDTICIELSGWVVWNSYMSHANQQEAHTKQLIVRLGVAEALDDYAAPLHQKIDDLIKERDALQAKLDAINSEARQEFERERKQIQADIDKVRKSLRY